MALQHKMVSLTFKVKPGKEEELKKFMERLAVAARRDEGNIEFHVLKAEEDPEAFMIFAAFRNQEIYERHLALAEVKEIAVQAEELFDGGYEVKLWEKYV